MRQALESNKIPTVEAKVSLIPNVLVSVDESKAKQIMKLLEMLDDHDDSQDVYSNFDMPAGMMDEE